MSRRRFLRKISERSRIASATSGSSSREETTRAVRYRIDDGVALMRGNESFEEFSLAGCVFAVTDQDDRFSAGLMSELFLTRQVNASYSDVPPPISRSSIA